MRSFIDQLDECPAKLRAIKETIIANIVFLGQIPAPTFHEKQRAIKFLDRLVESDVDECTTDGYQNRSASSAAVTTARRPSSSWPIWTRPLAKTWITISSSPKK